MTCISATDTDISSSERPGATDKHPRSLRPHVDDRHSRPGTGAARDFFARKAFPGRWPIDSGRRNRRATGGLIEFGRRRRRAAGWPIGLGRADRPATGGPIGSRHQRNLATRWLRGSTRSDRPAGSGHGIAPAPRELPPAAEPELKPLPIGLGSFLRDPRAAFRPSAGWVERDCAA